MLNIISKTLFTSILVSAGVGVSSVAASQELTIRPHSTSVLVTFRLSEKHVVKLVEFAPGLTGVVESGISVFGKALTPELKQASLTELFHRFAGKSARVPAAVLAADARAVMAGQANAAKWRTSPSRPTPIGGGARASLSDNIRSTYTYDEIYDWFYPIYCDQYGAKDCQLNYDGGWSMTPPVTYSSACFFVGSEGYNPASIEGLYWDWDYSTWIPVIDDNVDPGWAWCYSMNGGSTQYYLGWAMWGAGYDTTVGLSVYY